MKSESKDPETVTDSLLELKDDVTSEIDHYLGVVPSMANRKEYLVFLAASLLLSLGILLLLGYIYLWPLLKPYYLFVSDKEQLSGLLRSTGNLVPVVFILGLALQVLTIFWPMPLEIVGGYLFGLPLGVLLSTIGLTLGSVMAFLVGRWLERTYLRRLVDPTHEAGRFPGDLYNFFNPGSSQRFCQLYPGLLLHVAAFLYRGGDSLPAAQYLPSLPPGS